VNREEKQVFQNVGSAPLRWQDKHAPPRVRVASPEPSLPEKMAREESKVLSSQYLEDHPHEYNHSTKRQTVQAAGWVSMDTDAYINQRVREGKKQFGKKYTRSRAIRQMLEACAQSDMFERSQKMLVPIIQDAMRAEFRTFTNRFLAIIAQIAYDVERILWILMRYVSLQLSNNVNRFHQIEIDSDKDARVGVTETRPEIEEVKERIRQQWEGSR
jgi:hypothetical protein